MSTPLSSVIEDLEAVANGASRAEDEFRRTISVRIKALETERAFAFRRLNLMREVADAVTAADDEGAAIAQAATALRARLGWTSDSDARREVVEQFTPVTKAMFGQHTAGVAEGATADVVEASPIETSHTDAHVDVPVTEAISATDGVSVKRALATFETWYAATHPVPFWVLFENVMPETPVVDF